MDRPEAGKELYRMNPLASVLSFLLEFVGCMTTTRNGNNKV